LKNNKALRFAALFAALIAVLSCNALSSATPTTAPVIIATTQVVVSSPTDTATSVPATAQPAAQPTITIKLGPGKYKEPIWLEVIQGQYQLTSGDTLLEGSAIGVYTESLTFPTGLRIEIADEGLVLKGITYDGGTILTVDASGELVAESGSIPASPSTEADILYQDDFSSNGNDWAIGKLSSEYGEIDREIVDGQYVLTMMGKQEYYFSINSIPNFSGKDFVITMDVTVLESAVRPGDMSFELSLREVDGVNGKHYSFSLFNDGSSSGAVWPSGDYTKVVDFWNREPNEVIQFDKGKTNTISIEANGTTFTLYVNGQMIKTVTDKTIEEAGDISIDLGLDKPNQSLTIALDNLTITSIP
jgi:hypothetical protein